MKRRENRKGSVYKLSDTKRTRPWIARVTTGYTFNEEKKKSYPIYKIIGRYTKCSEATAALNEYLKNPYSLEGETLQIMYEKFIAWYAPQHATNSIRARKTSWNHLKPLYDTRMNDFSRKLLQEYFDGLDLSKQGKDDIKTLLRMIFDYSVRYDVIPAEKTVILNYIDTSSTKKAETKKRIVWNAEEIEDLKKDNTDIARTILFLIYTGMRPDELMHVCEDDYNEAEQSLHIRKSKTTAGIREIPLSEKAQKSLPLASYKNYRQLCGEFAKYRETKQFEHTLYDCRHTFVSLLTSKNVDLRIIQSLVGHKGNSVTENVYTHISMEDKRKAVNMI